jgi:Zn-dependent M28 family amino/carboxypeptidase
VRGTGEGDHIFNGANDDASGTAAVIEIANAIAAMPSRPARTIVFLAVFGEEMGLVGSRYYAAHPVFPLARTVADINLEQLGRTDVEGGSHPGMLNATGYDFTSITPVIREAAKQSGIELKKDEQHSDPYFSASDNLAFANAGVPSHTFSVGYMFPDYHRAGDEWQKLDYDNMARITNAIALGVYRIAASADPPQWNAAEGKTARYVKAREASTAAGAPRP